MRRLKAEFDELNDESTYEIATNKRTMMELKNTIESQKKQICSLKESKRVFKEKPEWSLSIFNNEIKRTLNATLKDLNLKKKIEKCMLEIMQEIEKSCNSIILQVIEQC